MPNPHACPIHGDRFSTKGEAVNIHEVTNRCTVCEELNHLPKAGRSKALGHEVHRPGHFPTYPVGTDGRIRDPADFAKWLGDLMADPVRYGELLAESRRPGDVSKSRHGIAIRAANKTPMLTAADPFKHLSAKEKKVTHAKFQVVKRFRVKPNNYKIACGNWLAREWTLWSMKYSSGFVIVNDKGDESQPFASWHLAKTAIEQSGFVLIK